ncbi:ABC transporter ATP-binding protein [Endozoicomonas sp. G2_1]|uniref:ABC transporter ATP-binding protein n=1 Tax=Endozoicomonas sp. G2_1 TaxID=2821091 RepID=UPI001AD975C2|nr:ABC transporter ATP-binding protein [Endozoicomonas sp. G2_1]MBO9491076.1 ABC transporter ATP-binding protein [Endozoicomonas sp. G2_1]
MIKQAFRASNIAVQLANKQILQDISFELAAGDILGLVGPSGCGKTTLLNTIAGFINQQRGELEIDQALTISASKPMPPEQRRIGMIFQDYALFPHLTVAANIKFGLSKLSKAEQAQRCSDLLALLKLDDFADRYPHQLSGGQQQRVAIARALAPRPKLLLLDEPFSNIDARLRNELMLELRQLLKSQGITAIFVTHNKDEVFTFADKIAVMHQGKIAQFGVPSEVCQQPNSWQVADFLQLGSWLSVVKQAGVLQSALGVLDFVSVEQLDTLADGSDKQLLIKPQYLVLAPTVKANVAVKHVSVTEQGYHYLVAPIGASVADNESSSPEQLLSFYSADIFQVEQPLSLSVAAHQALIF